MSAKRLVASVVASVLSCVVSLSMATASSPSKCADADVILDWNGLKEISGEPTPRLYSQKERLFGAEAPLVRLWHDSAAWHPFANQVWLLLEEMQIPHVRETVPLEQYLKPGEKISPEFQKLGVSVPAIQLAASRSNNRSSRVGDQSTKWSAPLRESSAVDIFRKLHQLFPTFALLPRTPKRRAFAEQLLDRYGRLQGALYGVIGSGGARAHAGYVSAMNEFEGAWSGNPAASFSLARFGDDADGDARSFGGPADGPFLFGERPCAVDVLLLPLLERCEANVPHPQIGSAPHLALQRWPALARLQAHARTPGTCAYAELGTDAHTTVGIRLGVTGSVSQLPPLQSVDLGQVLASLQQSSPHTRRDAASRLISNHAAITRFSCAGAGTGRSRQVARPPPDDTVLASTNDALQIVAQILLDSTSSNLTATAQVAQTGLRPTYKTDTLGKTAMNLVFLAENTGVPRDMSTAAATAFRASLFMVAKVLVMGGHNDKSPSSRK